MLMSDLSQQISRQVAHLCNRDVRFKIQVKGCQKLWHLKDCCRNVTNICTHRCSIPVLKRSRQGRQVQISYKKNTRTAWRRSSMQQCINPRRMTDNCISAVHSKTAAMPEGDFVAQKLCTQLGAISKPCATSDGNVSPNNDTRKSRMRQVDALQCLFGYNIAALMTHDITNTTYSSAALHSSLHGCPAGCPCYRLCKPASTANSHTPHCIHSAKQSTIQHNRTRLMHGTHQQEERQANPVLHPAATSEWQACDCTCKG